MRPPGWMVTEGWSLSHEAAGLATRDNLGGGKRPLRAFVRSRAEASVLMVGGRVLGALAGSTTRFTLSCQGRSFVSWDVSSEEGSFLRMWRLPAGQLAGREKYIALELRAVPVENHGVQNLDVRIEQFDLQSEDAIVYGFGSGWYQPEFDGAAPRPWRWTGPSAQLLVHSPGNNLVLRFHGEAPLKYVDSAPHVSVRAGTHPLGRAWIDSPEFDLSVGIPARALEEAGGVITVETDRTFVPDRVMGNHDLRQLGLRVYHVELRDDASPNANAATSISVVTRRRAEGASPSARATRRSKGKRHRFWPSSSSSP